MNYKELKKIVDKRIKHTSGYLPQDSFQIPSQLNVRLKNSIQCKEDCKGGQYLLERCNACYCIFKGEYTIYYDEKHHYKNFSVAHEIAHHLLGHTSDGAVQHHDAQLMAAIIVAPVELIHKHNIKSAVALAETCKMPIEVAENYWNELEENETMSINDCLKQIRQMRRDIISLLNCIDTLEEGLCNGKDKPY